LTKRSLGLTDFDTLETPFPERKQAALFATAPSLGRFFLSPLNTPNPSGDLEKFYPPFCHPEQIASENRLEIALITPNLIKTAS
jgi:hypothetical protein